ncbi:NUXM [Candida oxycetoniae]|uniref:NUXM n=1 Tax=Candida oxycetoniae TaxID=497107 RepID=A0AAI9X0F0_9ASCO|nr:NUXM [Candida oxycetoniae]KAI3406940.2 NUXM [Candida oxycetoniae]
MSYTATNTPVRALPLDSDYERIDGDPYFGRVVSYFRPSDYLNWAISTAIFPAGLKLWERIEPSGGSGSKPLRINGTTYRAAVAMGLVGGFFLAYVRSSQRFLGWRENASEVKRDRFEMKKLLSEGKLPFHEDKSALDDRNKDVANRNSQYSSSFLFILPWFNLAYHPYHQVNLEKYYIDRPGEEEWGFKLKPLDEIYQKNT